MFGLGFVELLVILVVALIVLGPEKLPEAAKMIGRANAYLRRTLDDLKHEINEQEYKPMIMGNELFKSGPPSPARDDGDQAIEADFTPAQAPEEAKPAAELAGADEEASVEGEEKTRD